MKKDTGTDSVSCVAFEGSKGKLEMSLQACTDSLGDIPLGQLHVIAETFKYHRSVQELILLINILRYNSYHMMFVVARTMFRLHKISTPREPNSAMHIFMRGKQSSLG